MTRQKSSSAPVLAILLLIGVLGLCMCAFSIPFANQKYNPIPALLGGLMGGLMAGLLGGLIGVLKGNATMKASRLGPLPWYAYPRDVKSLAAKHLDGD